MPIELTQVKLYINTHFVQKKKEKKEVLCNLDEFSVAVCTEPR